MLEGQKIDNVQKFYQMVGDRGNGTTEFYRYDGTNIRLREISLGYSFPQQMLERTGFIKGVDLSLVARNLFFIYKDAPFDPDATMSVGNDNQGLDTFGMLQRETLDSTLNLPSKYPNNMNKIKYTTALLLGGLLSFSSCTDNFADFNSTEGAYTDELQKYDNQTNLVPFSTIQKGIIYQTGVDGTDWQYQIVQNLVADMFCGYFHDMTGSFNANNSTYNLNNGWTSAMWVYTYGYVMPSIADAEALNTEKEWPLYHAITKILKVATLHRVSDYYGPILYDGFGTADQKPQSQEEVYKRFFEDLGTA